MSSSDSHFDPSDDDFAFVSKPKASKAKPHGKATAKSTATKMPSSHTLIVDSEEEEFIDNGDGSENVDPLSVSSSTHPTSTESNRPKSIEETYKKVSQLEHILLRPDTYVGAINATTTNMWIVNQEGELVNKSITYVPALYKIFDEIIVNAADNKVRDPRMNQLHVVINQETNEISIKNNGRGVPIEIHAEEGIHVPELIFGHLLTSSNYDDSMKKVVGGRNGFGAKLCNIFSTRFIVETADSKKKYRQVFSGNMKQKEEAVITAFARASVKNEYTKISFQPDLTKFNMDRLDDDTVSLLKRRVYDMAGCLQGVDVHLNGSKLDIKDFRSYVAMFLKDPTAKIVYEKIDRWEVAMVPSEDDFQQVSYVNSICTSNAGCHVTYITDQVVKRVTEIVKKKSKVDTVRQALVRNQLWVFINCQIENPAFSSQTKEHLTTRPSAFGSKCTLSEKFIKSIIATGIVDKALMSVHAKQAAQLKKTDGTKRSRVLVNKLQDASCAGTKQGYKCTLILTEGDSAKALVVAGMEIVGREYYGVYPLRGKVLNVRDAASKAVLDNKEISDLKQILGLQQGKTYPDASSLRYGHLMIMTDQDHDGSHIKGLIINLFDHFWPSLLKVPGFLCEFITPIIKCRPRGRPNPSDLVYSFFTIEEYNQWKDQYDSSRFNVKYYKGLGTSTNLEAKEYFSDLPTHKKSFDPCIPDDRALIDMAFNKKKADARKEWLANFEPGTFMDHSQPSIPVGEFINKELIQFSVMDNHRSIPSMVDGLKPGQRKILFSCFKRNLKDEIKVAQLVGYVAEHSAYHHGEQSLGGTIVNLAQDYVGSNNIPLLEPRGQFGTRLSGGADAASARYIFTTLAPITRKVFHPSDDHLLTYLDDDGKSVEPQWYIPTIPMVLINGASGIGTGWATNIPCFNPMDVIENLRRLIRGDSLAVMSPWYWGFKGTIDHISEDRYKVSGIYDQPDPSTLIISELPVGIWTSNFKSMLDDYSQGEHPIVDEYTEGHTTNTVLFEIRLTDAGARMSPAEIEKKFKLSNSISTSNMVCFDQTGRIKKYASAEQIIMEFFHLRLKLYVDRKDWLTANIKRELSRLEQKVRFIRQVVNRELIIERKKKNDLIAELRDRKFIPASKFGLPTVNDQDQDEDHSGPPDSKEFDYLLNMSLYSLTDEKIAQLEAEYMAKDDELKVIIATTAEEMWEHDLDDLAGTYNDYIDVRASSDKSAPKKGKGRSLLQTKPIKRKINRKNSDVSDSSDVDISNIKKPRQVKKRPLAVPKTASTSKNVLTKSANTIQKYFNSDIRDTSVSQAQNLPKTAIVPPTTISLDADSDEEDLMARLARVRQRAAMVTTPQVSLSGASKSAMSPSRSSSPKAPVASTGVSDHLFNRQISSVQVIKKKSGSLTSGKSASSNVIGINSGDDEYMPMTIKPTNHGGVSSSKFTVVDSDSDSDDGLQTVAPVQASARPVRHHVNKRATKVPNRRVAVLNSDSDQDDASDDDDSYHGD